MNTLNTLIQKATAVLKSRTVITLLFLFATNLVSVFGAHLNPSSLGLLNGVLALLAAYFRIDSKVNFHE